ncbi:hypothetical protein CRI93_02445 [Longimonas halophila]|uniref:Putative restriction endonuclease domain-containing protein n=1 Tax=Longimonas halophila TaxID=1469170 RepID=A0A2H3PBG5_9BACT|nr:Uma2 family endonuclease [Longimonas halophila]PEN09608.1 hypothetical protein CRI93_02445 [Longimonas halophila]
MPTTVSPTPLTESSGAPATSRAFRFSRAQYERMVDAGIFAPDQQVELINGLIVPMSPQSSRHTATVERIRRVLDAHCPADAYVRTQYPLALGAASEPEPDVAVVPGSLEDHVDAHPTHALLVVEVADTSLAYDRNTKRPLYATHGIATYWIANLNASQLEVYTNPEADDYHTKRTFAPSSSVPFADAVIAVSSLLPDRPST